MISYGRTLLRARLAVLGERGASAVEYGLLIAGIAALVVVAVTMLGGNLGDLFEDTADSLD
jgi:pilus assembly protein Flp/PilA